MRILAGALDFTINEKIDAIESSRNEESSQQT